MSMGDGLIYRGLTYRVDGSFLGDGQYWRMSAPQRAAYHAFVAWAAEQASPGFLHLTISDGTRGLRHAANLLCDGNVKVLKAMLTFCSTEWRHRDGTPEIVCKNGWTSVTSYIRLNRKDKAGIEPPRVE
jgi:hypothetical protein